MHVYNNFVSFVLAIQSSLWLWQSRHIVEHMLRNVVAQTGRIFFWGEKNPDNCIMCFYEVLQLCLGENWNAGAQTLYSFCTKKRDINASL